MGLEVTENTVTKENIIRNRSIELAVFDCTVKKIAVLTLVG